MNSKIDKAIENLLDYITTIDSKDILTNDANDALKFTQAALNFNASFASGMKDIALELRA